MVDQDHRVDAGLVGRHRKLEQARPVAAEVGAVVVEPDVQARWQRLPARGDAGHAVGTGAASTSRWIDPARSLAASSGTQLGAVATKRSRPPGPPSATA